MRTVGTDLVALLQGYGVELVFGIPGVHTVELYRGLAARGLRHLTPRHEQAAGFMADGYARVSGKPGVCFVITGPGLTNIATAMAQAHADSIPMLVISAVNSRAAAGRGLGHLHELPDQGALARQLAAFSATLSAPEALPELLARAFTRFAAARPRPVHIEIPLDLIGAATDHLPVPMAAPLPVPPVPAAAALDAAAARCAAARQPVLLLGGGARRAGEAARALAERLDAPAVLTINARGLLGRDHPLAIDASASLGAVRALLADSDLALAIGTELGPTDYDQYQTLPPLPLPALVRIDLDADQLGRNALAELPVLGDGGAALAGLLERCAPMARAEPGAARAARAIAAARAELAPAARRLVDLLELIRDALPAAAIVGDSTQPVYAGNLLFAPGRAGAWFNASVGYGTLGYALPAALGAKLADPDRPVVGLIGDGGLQFTLAELGTVADAGLPLILLVWNNRGYGEIASAMASQGVAPIGTAPTPPDFLRIAAAYGWAAERLADVDALPDRLRQAAIAARPTLIELDEAAILGALA
jgi:acetolactate synthase-1/2/3 large subunit